MDTAPPGFAVTAEIPVGLGANATSNLEVDSIASGGRLGDVWYGLSNDVVGEITQPGTVSMETLVPCESSNGIMALDGAYVSGANDAEAYACGIQGAGVVDTNGGIATYPNYSFLAFQNPANSDGALSNSFLGFDGGPYVIFDNPGPDCNSMQYTNACTQTYTAPSPKTVTFGRAFYMGDMAYPTTAGSTVGCPVLAVTEHQDGANPSSADAEGAGSAIDIFGFAMDNGTCGVDPLGNSSATPEFQRIPLPSSQSAPFGISSDDKDLYFVENGTQRLGRFDLSTGVISEFPLPSFALDLTCDYDYCYIPEQNANKIALFNIATDQITEVPVPTASAGPQHATIEVDRGSPGAEHVYFTELTGHQIGVLSTPFSYNTDSFRRRSLRGRRSVRTLRALLR